MLRLSMSCTKWCLFLLAFLLLVSDRAVVECQQAGNCTHVYSESRSDGVLAKVKRLSSSISYAGIDAIQAFNSRAENSYCRLSSISMVNKAGKIVAPTMDSIVATSRVIGHSLLSSQLCPGLGWCTDVVDADGPDSWPITAMT